MTYMKPLPQWENTGIEPNASLKANGFMPQEKPTAQHMNWLFNTSYQVLKELQEKSIPTSQKGQAGGVATLGANGKVPANQLDISVVDGTTTTKGIVQLDDNENSNSTTKAATANAVRKVKSGLDNLSDGFDNWIISNYTPFKNDFTQHKEQTDEHIKDYLAHGITGTTAGSANTYTLTPRVPLTAYQKGLRITLFVNVANTAASTLNISSKGAVGLKKNDGTDFEAGELAINTPYTFVYNGTDFLADSAGGGGEILINYENFYNILGRVSDPSTLSLNSAISGQAAASNSNYAIFSGGANNSAASVANVVAYNNNLTKTNITMPTTKSLHGSESINDIVLVAGGFPTNGDIVYTYDNALVRGQAENLSDNRRNFATIKTDNHILFGGGQSSGTDFLGSIDAYDANLVRSTLTSMPNARYSLAGAFNGAQAIFAGGRNSVVTNEVDAYNANLTRIGGIIGLSSLKHSLSGGRAGNSAIFAGGTINTSASRVSTVEAYNQNLTKVSLTNLNAESADHAACNFYTSFFIAGGRNGSGSGQTQAIIYNKNLIKENLTILGSNKYSLGATQFGNRVMLGTGLENSSTAAFATGYYYTQNAEAEITLGSGSKYKLNSNTELTVNSDTRLIFNSPVTGYIKMKTGTFRGGI